MLYEKTTVELHKRWGKYELVLVDHINQDRIS